MPTPLVRALIRALVVCVAALATATAGLAAEHLIGGTATASRICSETCAPETQPPFAWGNVGATESTETGLDRLGTIPG
jgi:hypothetical protein